MSYESEKGILQKEMKEKINEYTKLEHGYTKDSEATREFNLYCVEFNKRFKELKAKYNIE